MTQGSGKVPCEPKKAQNSLGARVIAIADSFDAMTADCLYRKALASHQAIQVLVEGRGTQWEPNVVNAFVDMIAKQLDEKSTEALFRQPTGSPSSQAILISP